MFNVMLDPLPETWKGYSIRSDFRIGIQIAQCLSDSEFTIEERIQRAIELLFVDVPVDYWEAREGLSWFLTEFCHDDYSHVKKEDVILMDYDIDQWRIYSAFLAQYNIDLNRVKMHWFMFMGLLNNLEECAYTRVIDIRRKKIDPKMSSELKKNIYEAKQIYTIEKEEETVDTAVEDAAVAEFNRLRNSS